MTLIDRDALEKVYVRNSITDTVTVGGKTVLRHLREAPTIDAVPVVRCKECKYSEWDSKPHDAIVCTRTNDGYWRKSDDFCSYGERRSE